MKSYRPREWASLMESGRVEVAARKFEDRALLAFQSVLNDLKRLNPAPTTYPGRVQHEQNLRSMAREQVLADLLEIPEEQLEREEMTLEEAELLLSRFFGKMTGHDTDA